MQHVTDPRTGIQRTNKWLPEVAEVVEACEAEIGRRQRLRRLAELPRREPKLLEAPRDPEKDAIMAAKFKQLVTTLTSNMKLSRASVGQPPEGITREQWEEIPNA